MKEAEARGTGVRQVSSFENKGPFATALIVSHNNKACGALLANGCHVPGGMELPGETNTVVLPPFYRYGRFWARNRQTIT
jgi:hypothetical protein